uniref:Peptidase M3A/M3B catalytic domain-containing protein n=1 Tax=Timema douglasi TaxID=61478 RepID=A0A7R8Z6T4_TIMDO|nr:unnamed protein product [Timema douglasi]
MVAKSAQQKELELLEDFAAERGFGGSLKSWDVPYWKRKQQRTIYSYDEEELREYFPLPQVLSGLFTLCENLFGLTIMPQPDVDTWHPDVQYYHILEGGKDTPIAGFYLDPYERAEEKLFVRDDSGWMVALRNKTSLMNTNPLAALVFNFPQPLYGKPSLLPFRDVLLLFRKRDYTRIKSEQLGEIETGGSKIMMLELDAGKSILFGHALQHLLTKTSYAEVSGSSNVEWDAVEVCSHFMTHWFLGNLGAVARLYEPSTLANISSHYESGKPLPDDIVDKLCKVRQHLAGYDLCQELYLSALDLELHTTKEFWLDIVRRLLPQYSSFPLETIDSHPCAFLPIFTGQWGAAYYCHLWARIIAADAFSAFREVDRRNSTEISEIGRRFRNTILASGGGCHPSKVFRLFRGRDPSPSALLYTLGLKEKKSLIR